MDNIKTKKNNGKIDSDIRRHIDDLLYIEKCVSDRIHAEISEVLMGRGQTAEELGDRLKYVIEERIDCMKADEKRTEKKKDGKDKITICDYNTYGKDGGLVHNFFFSISEDEFLKMNKELLRRIAMAKVSFIAEYATGERRRYFASDIGTVVDAYKDDPENFSEIEKIHHFSICGTSFPDMQDFADIFAFCKIN